jgi:hypothetical protein
MTFISTQLDRVSIKPSVLSTLCMCNAHHQSCVKVPNLDKENGKQRQEGKPRDGNPEFVRETHLELSSLRPRLTSAKIAGSANIDRRVRRAASGTRI